MSQEEKREEIFSKWREAKDNALWIKCDNCARDLLSTLDIKLKLRKDLEWFYNEIQFEAKNQAVMLKGIQDLAPPLKREFYNPLYENINIWWANELYDKFHTRFLKDGLIKKEK